MVLFNVILNARSIPVFSRQKICIVMNISFQEITRVLRNGGRYICISLLQEHILRHLLSYFPNVGFMFRIVRCHEAEAKTRAEEGSSIPVFAVIATKFANLPQTVMLYSFL